MGLKLEWDTETLDDGRIQSQADCGGYVAWVESYEKLEGAVWWAAVVYKANRMHAEEPRVAWSNHSAEPRSLAAVQEAAEAAAARLLAEDAGVRALMGMVELRTRAEKAEIDGECYRLAAQHHYKQYTEADTALTRVVTKLGNAAIRVAELEAALRWRSVGEDLPAAGQCVMVPNPMAGMSPRKEAPRYVERYYNHPHRIWLDLDGRTVPPPAHWRPLPPGPEVGQ